MADTTNPQLSITTTADWMKAQLRVDQIRRDTLVSLVAGWGDDDTRDAVIGALDALAEAVLSPREGELDGLVGRVDGAASMDWPQVDVPLTHLLRLRDELDIAIERLGRFHPAAVVRPARRGAERGAA